MRNHILKIVFFFLIAYCSTAQSVLNLRATKTTQIESYNSKNELTGSGVSINDADESYFNGTLSDQTGQKTGYFNRFGFSQSDRGLEVDLRFYLNPFLYSQNLEVSYTGDKALFPAAISETSILPDVKGTFNFSLKGKPFIEENGKLIDRKVTGVQKLELGGEVLTAYLISSTYHAKTTRKGLAVNETTEHITEWYVPGQGIIKSLREGTGPSIIFKLK